MTSRLLLTALSVALWLSPAYALEPLIAALPGADVAVKDAAASLGCYNPADPAVRKFPGLFSPEARKCADFRLDVLAKVLKEDSEAAARAKTGRVTATRSKLRLSP